VTEPATPGIDGESSPPGARLASWFFVAAALLEALGWIALLIAMYVKWIADAGERGVEIVGPIHGALFIVYLVATGIAAERLRWTTGETAIGLAAGVPPLATVLFERWMAARGRLYGGA
jgi:integral membrane protein